MQILGIIELILAMIYILIHYRNEGYLFTIDVTKIGFLIWLSAMGLYNIRISTLLHPNLFINGVSLLILGNFYMMSKVKFGILDSLKTSIKELNRGDVNQYFDGGIIVIFAMGFMATAMTYIKYGFALLNSNHLVRTKLSMGYFYEALVVVALYSYMSIRSRKKAGKRLLVFILLCLSLSFLALRMNRGSIFFVFFGVVVYEILNFYDKKGKKYLSGRAKGYILLLAVAFIFIFGLLGDMRTEKVVREVYHTTYLERSGMPANFPSGLGQIYLYMTTPIENASYTLQNQTINNPTFLNNLLYPFIKILANFVGLGGKYSAYVGGIKDTTPILWSQAGFNATSFMVAAYQDLDLLGIPVYLIFFDLIILFISKILKLKLKAISKIIIYSLLVQTIIWSVFQNSAFHIAVLWVDTFFIIIFDMLSRKVRISINGKYNNCYRKL